MVENPEDRFSRDEAQTLFSTGHFVFVLFLSCFCRAPDLISFAGFFILDACILSVYPRRSKETQTSKVLKVGPCTTII